MVSELELIPHSIGLFLNMIIWNKVYNPVCSPGLYKILFFSIVTLYMIDYMAT